MRTGFAQWVLGVCAAAGLLASAGVQSQALQPDDGVIPLLDLPIMQQPIQQGVQSLIPMQAPQAAQGGQTKLMPLTRGEDTRDLCDSAVQHVAAHKVDQAFHTVAPYWPLAPEEIGRLANQTRSQLGELTEKYGPIVGYEWIRSRIAGQSLMQHLYLVKLQYHALRMGCTFYRPTQTWQVHTIFWDDQIETFLGP